MKRLLAILLFSGVLQAQVTPLIPRGTHPSTSSASSAAPTAIHSGSLNVQPYLAPCASSVMVNACATNAANQAKAAGLALHFPAGTYLLTAWAPPCPSVIVGDGIGKTILKRPAGSAGSVITSTGCGGLQISNLTIDGNKANNLAIGYTVVLRRNWNFNLD